MLLGHGGLGRRGVLEVHVRRDGQDTALDNGVGAKPVEVRGLVEEAVRLRFRLLRAEGRLSGRPEEGTQFIAKRARRRVALGRLGVQRPGDNPPQRCGELLGREPHLLRAEVQDAVGQHLQGQERGRMLAAHAGREALLEVVPQPVRRIERVAGQQHLQQYEAQGEDVGPAVQRGRGERVALAGLGLLEAAQDFRSGVGRVTPKNPGRRGDAPQQLRSNT